MSKLDKFEEYVIAPGETISELLEVNCMTQLDLANKTGINNKPPPKPEAFDIPAAMNIEKNPNMTGHFTGKIESCLHL